MTSRLTTNYAKNYCNRTLIVKVIVENVVTCFLLGHGVFLIIITQIHPTLTTVTAVFILQQMCTLRALVIMNSLISALTSTKYQHTTNMHYLSHCRYRP